MGDDGVSGSKRDFQKQKRGKMFGKSGKKHDKIDWNVRIERGLDGMFGPGRT